MAQSYVLFCKMCQIIHEEPFNSRYDGDLELIIGTHDLIAGMSEHRVELKEFSRGVIPEHVAMLPDFKGFKPGRLAHREAD